MRNHARLLTLTSILAGVTFLNASDCSASCPELILQKDIDKNIATLEMGEVVKVKAYVKENGHTVLKEYDGKVTYDKSWPEPPAYERYQLRLNAKGNKFPNCDYHRLKSNDQTLWGNITFKFEEGKSSASHKKGK